VYVFRDVKIFSGHGESKRGGSLHPLGPQVEVLTSPSHVPQK
jgi:hypothetical protein